MEQALSIKFYHSDNLSIGERCGKRDNLSVSTVQRENYCRDKWSVSLHWSEQNPFVSLIYLDCTFILVGSEVIFIHNFYKMSKKEKKKKRFRFPIILVLITDKIKWFWSYNTKKGEKKKKFRVPINLVLITDKIKWFWSYNTRDYHLLFPFLFLIAIYSSYCLLNGVQIFCPTFPALLYILPIKTCYIFTW